MESHRDAHGAQPSDVLPPVALLALALTPTLPPTLTPTLTLTLTLTLIPTLTLTRWHFWLSPRARRVSGRTGERGSLREDLALVAALHPNRPTP